MTAAAFHALLAHPSTGARLDRMAEDFKRIDAQQPITVPARVRDLPLADTQRPCDVCGLPAGSHFDGWDGNYLGCEETANRIGPPRPITPVVDVALEPVPDQPAGPVVDVAIVPTRRLLQPGDLPTPVTRKERQAFTQAEADDVRRALGVRPNLAYRADQFGPCPMSKFARHKFTANFGRTCTFCLRDYTECLLKKETP